MDITYINIAGTFFYLCAILDGATRFLVHWELGESMTSLDVETTLQRAREHVPGAKPRIISDNGPQFIARGFRDFIRLAGMTHVSTSPYYPQSNVKLERWNQTLKTTTIRPQQPQTLEEGRSLVAGFVHHSITCACTARSASSRQPTNWPAGLRRSMLSVIANSNSLAHGGASFTHSRQQPPSALYDHHPSHIPAEPGQHLR